MNDKKKIFLWMPTFRKGTSYKRQDSRTIGALGIPLIYNMDDYYKLNGFLKENNALLINPNNTDELASAILYLLNSTDLLLKYGQMGYKHSLNFNWQNTATSTLKAYESILI